MEGRIYGEEGMWRWIGEEGEEVEGEGGEGVA